jgi:D-3-phosphoglycerate dehydrogenase
MSEQALTETVEHNSGGVTALVGAGKTVVIGAVRWDALCASGRAMLIDAVFSLVENEIGRPYEFADVAERIGSADAVVSGVEIWNDSVFDLAPRLKIIARLGVGLDNVDLDAARARGIDVMNVPGGNAIAVAELALGLTLSVLRKIPAMDTGIRRGAWDRFVGQELGGKAIGMIGFGAVAQTLARRLQGFGVSISAYDPYGNAEVAAELGVRLTDLHSAVSDADVVSVHAPHLPSTHHVVTAGLLATMKPGAVVINTSRGGLIDEAALVAALESGHIAGAGLDVFEVEPVSVDNPLLSFGTVVATTHAAADSVEAYDRIGRATAQAIIDVFSGRRPQHLAN